MTLGQFSNSFPKHFSYLCEFAFRFDLSCSFCEYPFIFHCLHCSPSCFDPDSLLLAHLWLGLSWIDSISANKRFSSPKTSSRKPYTSSKQQERQKHSAETTINFSPRIYEMHQSLACHGFFFMVTKNSRRVANLTFPQDAPLTPSTVDQGRPQWNNHREAAINPRLYGTTRVRARSNNLDLERSGSYLTGGRYCSDRKNGKRIWDAQPRLYQLRWVHFWLGSLRPSGSNKFAEFRL